MKYIIGAFLVCINVYGMQPIDTAEIDKLALSQDLPSAQEYDEQQNFAQALERNVSMAKMKLNPQIFAEIQNWSARELQILREKQLKAESQKADRPEPVIPAERPQIQKKVSSELPSFITIPFAAEHAHEGDHGQFKLLKALLHLDKATSSRKQKSEVDAVRIYSRDVRLPGYQGSIIDSENAQSFSILQGSKNKFFALIRSANVVLPILHASIITQVNGAELVEIPAQLEKFNRLTFQVSQAKPADKR